ncbi:MAG: hypothetical protein A2V86_01905 [Deltaproteobacteria bacterium RBG_16_49_23]|nr:MAG: hypothetical protein A2V86_01905 [Deltaproteobacteria bacterium RBG_16_49_23]
MNRISFGHPSPRWGEGKGEGVFKKISYLFLILLLALSGTQCAAPKEELHSHGDLAPVKTYPKDYVHPLIEINLEKVIDENRGLRVLEENAKTVNDYYRAGVQEKEEGERLLKEERWEEARKHFGKSNWFLQVVLDYFSKDEAYRNIYGDHVVIFLPNLLVSDNYLKLIEIFKKLKMDEEIYWTSREGKKYLSFSLRNVKTEWAFQIKKGFEESDKK